jgi:hypothetical protein
VEDERRGEPLPLADLLPRLLALPATPPPPPAEPLALRLGAALGVPRTLLECEPLGVRVEE